MKRPAFCAGHLFGCKTEWKRHLCVATPERSKNLAGQPMGCKTQWNYDTHVWSRNTWSITSLARSNLWDAKQHESTTFMFDGAAHETSTILRGATYGMQNTREMRHSCLIVAAHEISTAMLGAPGILPATTPNVARATKSGTLITKGWACKEKWHCNITNRDARHEKWHSREATVRHHQMLLVPRKDGQTAPNVGHATKSNSPTLPSLAPATKSNQAMKSDTPKSHGAPATKSGTPTSPTAAPAAKSHSIRFAWRVIYRGTIRTWSEHQLVVLHPSIRLRQCHFSLSPRAFCTTYCVPATMPNFTTCVACNEEYVTLQHHQMLRLPRKVTLQHQQMVGRCGEWDEMWDVMWWCQKLRNSEISQVNFLWLCCVRVRLRLLRL